MDYKKTILFIGAINENKTPLGGEEYKNQLILSKLKKEPVQLIYIDTVSWKRRPGVILRLLRNILLRHFDSVIISASSVSTYRLLQLVNFVRPSLIRKTAYIVTGGYFPYAIQKGLFKVQPYNNLRSIIVQGESLKKTLLKHLKETSIFTVPNFKYIPEVKFNSKENTNIFRFVFVGRISEAKGVADIIKSVRHIEQINSTYNFIVDFYGPQEEQFDFDFCCKYKGYLDFSRNPEDSYQKLSNYDCFLFPTTWKGEGFPGVIIDAYIAGLPIIATDWNMNSEIIKDGENGYLIPSKDINALTKKMMWVMENRQASLELGLKNKETAKDYHIDNVWPKLFDLIK